MKDRTLLMSGASILISILFVLILAISLGHADTAGKVNLNTASFSELDRLPGVGPVIAERILEFRKANGPFKRIEDLMNVRGIGEKKFLKIKDRITVDSQESRQTRSATPP